MMYLHDKRVTNIAWGGDARNGDYIVQLDLENEVKNIRIASDVYLEFSARIQENDAFKVIINYLVTECGLSAIKGNYLQ